MLNIKKVFFNNTVHWPGLGPLSEVCEQQFHDAMWVENMPGFAFEHLSGEITWVPASNIRWAQAIIDDEATSATTVIEPVHDIDDVPSEEAPIRKRGRPKKNEVH